MSRQNIPGTSIPDLSSLTTGGNNGSAPEALRNPNYASHSSPNRRNLAAEHSNPFGHEIAEVTPSEMIRIEAVQLELNKRYMGKQFGDSDSSLIDEFERVVTERFGALGFIVRVEWIAVEADGMPGRAYLPNIAFLARTAEKVTDHDEIAHEVRAGLVDGKVGTIREDGSWREDSIRKQL